MTQAVSTKFNFKARKIEEEGKEIGKTKKQPPLTVALPQPTVEEMVAYLQRPDHTVKATKKIEGKDVEVDEVVVDKVKQLIVDAIQEIVRDQAKGQLDELIDSFGADETKVLTAESIDYDKLSLEFIANLPPAQRGARAIPEEDWKAFFQDYMQVMVAATGKPEMKIKNHLDLFQKPTKAKQNKEALAVLVDQLNVYMTATQNLDDTAECVQRLQNKFQKWIDEDAKLDVSAL